MNEEQKEKWYNSFTREQLVERCEYLQRSCERKENSIMELEMEIANLESKIEKQGTIIKEVRELLENDYWWNWDTDNDKIIRKILEIINKVEGKK